MKQNFDIMIEGFASVAKHEAAARLIDLCVNQLEYLPRSIQELIYDSDAGLPDPAIKELKEILPTSVAALAALRDTASIANDINQRVCRILKQNAKPPNPDDLSPFSVAQLIEELNRRKRRIQDALNED